MASGVSFDAAIAGLQKGVESARAAGASLAKSTQPVAESAASSSGPADDGKGAIIDVTV